jgi:hypothetical protein
MLMFSLLLMHDSIQTTMSSIHTQFESIDTKMKLLHDEDVSLCENMDLRDVKLDADFTK